MRTANLAVNESDLEVVYGKYRSEGDPREEALGSLKYLYTDLTDIRKVYIRLGFHLKEFKDCEYYKDFGYMTLEDFCDANLGLDKSAVSRCINVHDQFSALNDVKYVAGTKSCGSGLELSDQWKDYSYTQLCEMLPLSDEERRNITPDMSVKQIREYKKRLKQKDPAGGLVASTQPEDTEHDPVASTQLFDFYEYENKKGIDLYNYIKECDPIEDGILKYLYIFDYRGREIAVELQCEILLNDDNEIVIRLDNPSKPLEWDEDPVG